MLKGVKMDIEGSEFNWLDYMREDELDNFSQIVLEVHWPFDIYRSNMLKNLTVRIILFIYMAIITAIEIFQNISFPGGVMMVQSTIVHCHELIYQKYLKLHILIKNFLHLFTFQTPIFIYSPKPYKNHL